MKYWIWINNFEFELDDFFWVQAWMILCNSDFKVYSKYDWFILKYFPHFAIFTTFYFYVVILFLHELNYHHCVRHFKPAIK